MTEFELDILNIDNKIQLLFENESKKLPQYIERLEELEKTFNSPNLPTRTRIELEKSISEIQQIIVKTESQQDLNFYIVETAELLEKYKQI